MPRTRTQTFRPQAWMRVQEPGRQPTSWRRPLPGKLPSSCGPRPTRCTPRETTTKLFDCTRRWGALPPGERTLILIGSVMLQ